MKKCLDWFISKNLSQFSAFSIHFLAFFTFKPPLLVTLFCHYARDDTSTHYTYLDSIIICTFKHSQSDTYDDTQPHHIKLENQHTTQGNSNTLST